MALKFIKCIDFSQGWFWTNDVTRRRVKKTRWSVRWEGDFVVQEGHLERDQRWPDGKQCPWSQHLLVMSLLGEEGYREACCFLSISIHSFGMMTRAKKLLCYWVAGERREVKAASRDLLPHTTSPEHAPRSTPSCVRALCCLLAALRQAHFLVWPHTTLWPGWRASPVQWSNAREVLFSVRIEIRCL